MENKQRIMIADDARMNRKILSQLLEDKYEVIIAENGGQVLQLVENDWNIDLILLDVIMPGMNGYEVLKLLKEMEQVKDTPVIFITALNSVEDEENGLKLGASDYITKPFNPAIVKLRVENHLKFVRQRKLLETLVGRDGLTEISNRRRFDERLIKEWNRTKRNQKPLSIVMIDVDNFKSFNDRYGHASGDSVLKAVAKTLSEHVRPIDMAARYGGEEFVLILSGMDVDDAKALANLICKMIEALGIPHESSKTASVLTVSMGGATLRNQDITQDDLVKAADEMLYKAKNNGRNRVVWRDV